MFNFLESTLPGIASMVSMWVSQIVNYNNGLTSTLFKNSAVNSFLGFVGVLGSIMFICGTAFAFADWAISTQDTDGGTQVINTFKNVLIGFVALLSFTTVPILLFLFIGGLCQRLCDASSLGSVLDYFNNFSVTEDIDYMSFFSPDVMGIIYVLIMFVCVVRLFFSNIKRGGILIILIFVCTVHLFSIPRGYTDAFWSWCKQVIGICITNFIQNFLVVLSLILLSTLSTTKATTESMIISAGVALSAAEAPRILQQFGLDTTMKTNVSQAIFGVSGAMHIVGMLSH